MHGVRNSADLFCTQAQFVPAELRLRPQRTLGKKGKAFTNIWVKSSPS